MVLHLIVFINLAVRDNFLHFVNIALFVVGAHAFFCKGNLWAWGRLMCSSPYYDRKKACVISLKSENYQTLNRLSNAPFSDDISVFDILWVTLDDLKFKI